MADELTVQEEETARQVRQIEAMALNLDGSAMAALDALLMRAEVSDRIKLEAARTWLEHRRETQIALARLADAVDKESPSALTINISTNTDDPNVRRIRERWVGAAAGE